MKIGLEGVAARHPAAKRDAPAALRGLSLAVAAGVCVHTLTFLMFFMRSEPAQSIAKPACIMNTSAPCA